ncbi:MAG: YafY family protein [Chitinispirillia bacterium]|jgi:predicted DNA-binding transcriptional regulator YafY
MRIDRMLSIIIILLNRRSITARELSDKFEISIRTAYRDIQAINNAGIPVVSYQGAGGGYCIMENYRISKQLLTLKDMATILNALKSVNSAFKNRELDNAIEKINSIVPTNRINEVSSYLEQYAIDAFPWGFSAKKKEQLQSIHNAISNSYIIQFGYRNQKNIKSQRTVEPLTLLYKGNTWYLFSFCLMRNDFRIFRLSRIKALKITDTHFIRKKASYKDYLEAAETPEKMVNLILKFNPAVQLIVEDSFDEDQIKYLDTGELLVKVCFPEDEWLYSYILSFGESVEVIEPINIRQVIINKAKKIKKIYET